MIDAEARLHRKRENVLKMIFLIDTMATVRAEPVQ